MIYTVTFNPSLDYIIGVDDLTLGTVNRTAREQITAGGKGVNVSIVLNNLAHPSRALGFTAGFTGAEIKRQLSERGIACDFIEVARGMSRINVKIKSDVETEINGAGPDITAADVEALYRKLDALGAGDVLVISGSVPPVLPGDIYERIMARVADRGVLTAVDATKDLLTNVLAYRPFLIKPNNHELGELFGVSIERREEVAPFARRLQEQGARNVLVSMAGEGAVLVTEEGTVVMSAAPRGTVVNSVGAGDSMVAGFIAGYLETLSLEHAFHLGLCAGSASAFKMGLATRDEVELLLDAQRTRAS